MKIGNQKFLALAFCLSLLFTNANAAVENLSVDNSSYSNAQYLGNLSAQILMNVFGVRGSVYSGQINDNDNADFYSFDINAPTTLKLSVFTPAGPIFNNDPVLGLYDANGVQLAFDDDSGAGWDSFLQYAIGAPGRYIAAVSGYDDTSFAGGGDSNFLYNLQAEIAIVQGNPVPVPGAFWLMGSSLLGLASFRRKRTL
ncbi:DVUA0089 family protein [Methylomonas methanica]|uniref:Peptidase domain protein n=1 Tax=Methylomonas methanica (strain DSM 25384 / MC09) TaxID=857087 RepID=G0A4B5_METMM|nr:DVUA0089 family protein [Methylomonas methanica]AEG00331.1 peptidase domain protein [Methylomonas methanica MC09]